MTRVADSPVTEPVAGLGDAEGNDGNRQVREADVAHASARGDADSGEALLLELREDHGLAFVDALDTIAQAGEVILQELLVVDEIVR